MSDHDAISETVFHYCEGYRNKNRQRPEKASSLEVANMMGYIKNEKGDLALFSMMMKDAIDSWVAPDYTPFEFSDGNILAVDIFSDIGATVLLDFGSKYLESYQLTQRAGFRRERTRVIAVAAG